MSGITWTLALGLLCATRIPGGVRVDGTDPAIGRLHDDDHPWLKCGEGSWVELKTSTRMTTPAMESEQVVKRTLVKKGDKLRFRVESKMIKPTPLEIPAREVEEDSKQSGETKSTSGQAEVKKLGEGEEEIEIAGKKVKCKWTRVEEMLSGRKTTITSWTSDDVPGTFVKSHTKNADMESTTVVTGFKKK